MLAIIHGLRAENEVHTSPVTISPTDELDHNGQIGDISGMVRANVAELKANLSRYLRMVAEGQEVVVCQRNRPIARIVRLAEYDAAPREVFAEKGYTGASMAGIAERAGFAKGLLYHYFGAKRDLWREVVDEYARGGAQREAASPADIEANLFAGARRDTW